MEFNGSVNSSDWTVFVCYDLNNVSFGATLYLRQITIFSYLQQLFYNIEILKDISRVMQIFRGEK